MNSILSYVKSPVLPAVALLFIAEQSTVYSATVVANFSDALGTGTTFVDQWTGKAGSGWTAGWVSTGSSGVTVTNTSPINSSGNYLSVTTGTTNVDTGRARSFDGTASGVDITAAYKMSFDLRPDTLTGFGTATDYISVHGSTGGGVGPASTYIIRAFGANSGTAVAGNWAFYNGASDGTAYNQNLFVNSGMAMTVGTVYHFEIVVDPVTKKYTATINNGTTTVSSGELGWRSSAAASGIAFNERISDEVNDKIIYSVDNISIVPEPGAMALACCFGILGIFLRKRT